MARFVTIILVLAVVACVCAAPGRNRVNVTGEAKATGGSIAVGSLKGGTFGKGSFSIGHGGDSGGNGDGGHGGNFGNNYYGGSVGDSGHTSYA